MQVRKLLGPLLALLLATGVGSAIYFSATKKSEQERTRIEAQAMVVIRGLIGSEKESFFSDQRVAAALRKQGLVVHVEKVGSRQIALRQDIKNYDFGFPAGVPAALKLQQQVKSKQTFPTFFTAMAVASWKSLIPTLEANGLVKQIDGIYYLTDFRKLIEMTEKGIRWRDLKNNQNYTTNKSVLISSTDVRKSNSGAMYLALASYVANDNNIVQSDEQVTKILPLMAGLFLKQGLQEASSAGPFEDYLAMGIGKAPLVMIYESQFLEHQAQRKERNQDMILLYPQPTIFTKHIFVPVSEQGIRLGEALANDPELQRLAAEFGYRTANPEHFANYVKKNNLTAPVNLAEVIDPPSYEVLEKMIQEIEKKF